MINNYLKAIYGFVAGGLSAAGPALHDPTLTLGERIVVIALGAVLSGGAVLGVTNIPKGTTTP